MSDLFSLLRSRRWNEALEVLGRDSSSIWRQTSRVTSSKVGSDAPVSYISLQLEDPTDQEGRNYLHLACIHRAPITVMQRLLSLCPAWLCQPDALVWTPLHYQIVYGNDMECTRLLITSQSAQSKAPSVGSPLALACRHGCDADILRLLVQADPTALWESPSPVVLLYGKATRHHNTEYILQTLDVILNALYRHQGLTEVLHLDASLGRGRTHYARLHLQAHGASCLDSQSIYMACAHHDPDIIRQILHVDVSVARCLSVDGQLPLHWALCNQLEWQTGIQALVEAHPDALSRLDPHTRLYPALQATYDMATAYHLLRTEPSILQAQMVCT